jgi:hypothetical protein
MIQSAKPAEKNSFTTGTGGNLTITPGKQVYNPRDKISFSIQGISLPENSVAHLSVSVSEVITGFPVEADISECFGKSRSEPGKNHTKQSFGKFFSETNGAVIQGRILKPSEVNIPADSARGKDTSEYTLLISTPDSLVNMQYTKTDSSGSFKILLNHFYDGRELIIRLKDKANARIFTDNKFNLNTNYVPSHAFYAPGIKTALIRSGKIALVRKTYKDQLTIKSEKEFLPAATIPRLYYNNYISVYPSDYVSLNDFVEISREILPALKIRKTGDGYTAGYPALQYQSQGESEPAIFLDGVPIDDISQVITMGTDQVKRVDMLPEIRYYGDISFSGILAIFSSDLRVKNLQFKGPSLRMDALSSQPYTRPEPFTQDNINKHYPDLRQLLLWEPEIVINKGEKQLEFYASDLEGEFRIDIQGITTDGNTLSGYAIITIKSKTK